MHSYFTPQCIYITAFYIERTPVVKGTWTRLVKFVYINYFFLPQTFIYQQYEVILNRTTTFKLNVHEIKLHAAFEEIENKQKNAKFNF